MGMSSATVTTDSEVRVLGNTPIGLSGPCLWGLEVMGGAPHERDEMMRGLKVTHGETEATVKSNALGRGSPRDLKSLGL